MTTHIINFTGPINSHTCGQMIEQCSRAVEAEATQLILTIATMGGECSYGFSLYNFLTALPVPVHTHNLGTVESMGNIIYLAGERRTACRCSKFLFHPFHWTLNGAVDHARMAEYAMSLDYDLDLYAQIVAERTRGAAEALDIPVYLRAAPRIVAAQEAIACGLAHEILELGLQKGAISSGVHL